MRISGNRRIRRERFQLLFHALQMRGGSVDFGMSVGVAALQVQNLLLKLALLRFKSPSLRQRGGRGYGRRASGGFQSPSKERALDLQAVQSFHIGLELRL